MVIHVNKLYNSVNIFPCKYHSQKNDMYICISSLREQSSEVRHDVLSEIQVWGCFQEELKGLQHSVLSVLSVLQSQSDPRHIRVSPPFVHTILLLLVDHDGDIDFKFVTVE